MHTVVTRLFAQTLLSIFVSMWVTVLDVVLMEDASATNAALGFTWAMKRFPCNMSISSATNSHKNKRKVQRVKSWRDRLNHPTYSHILHFGPILRSVVNLRLDDIPQ